MLAPFAPFAAEELWRVGPGEASSVTWSSWPTFDPALAVEERVTLIVQVDGKVRDKIEVPAGIADEARCSTAARDAERCAARDRRTRGRRRRSSARRSW